MINFSFPSRSGPEGPEKFIFPAFINFFGRRTQAAFGRKNVTKSLVACFFPSLNTVTCHHSHPSGDRSHTTSWYVRVIRRAFRGGSLRRGFLVLALALCRAFLPLLLLLRSSPLPLCVSSEFQQRLLSFSGGVQPPRGVASLAKMARKFTSLARSSPCLSVELAFFASTTTRRIR
jgi:hypothetical protein